jgi:tetratricopeptide (TPR) repeat protein
VKERRYGPDHPSALVTLDLFARVLGNLHQDDRAIPLSRAVAERATRSLGERHPTTLTYLNNLAQALRKAGQLDEAEPIFRRVIELRRETDGLDSQERMLVMNNLGLLLMQRNAPLEALPLFQESLEGLRKSLAPDHWMLGVALLSLGRCETALGDYPAAERTLRDAHELLERTLGPANGRTVQVKAALAELYDAWGKPEQAVEWRVPK